MIMYIMTCHKRLIGFDSNNTLIQINYKKNDVSNLLSIPDIKEDTFFNTGPLSGFLAVTDKQNSNFIRFQKNDLYLCAEKDHNTLNADRRVPGQWEMFYLIPENKV